MKYTEEYLRSICKGKSLNFIKIEIKFHAGKKRRMIRFICDNHKDKGEQLIPVEKLCSTKKPCKYCNHSKLKETFAEEMAKINPNITILSKYINWNTKIKCKCNIDGYIWDAAVSVLLYGGGCPICGRQKANKNESHSFDYISRKITETNNNIEVIGDYRGYKNYIKCRCKIDGYEWESMVCHLISGSAGCPKCAARRTRERCGLTNKEFVSRINNINPDIQVLEKYQNNSTKLKFKCLKHNYIFKATPKSFLYGSGNGCPLCSQSSGERRMIQILKNNGRNIITQYSFSDCKNILPLRFDAYDVDNKIAYEYQGGQHYRPIDFAGKGKDWAKEQFKIGKHRDKIKKEYCERNNIKLVEIPYWECNNMEKYLIDC